MIIIDCIVEFYIFEEFWKSKIVLIVQDTMKF